MKIIKNMFIQDNYSKEIILNYVFRIAIMVLGLVSVKVNLVYLGNSLYGIWVTMATIISWMSSGDFGIGNGLRNELAKAHGEGNIDKQQRLIAVGVNELFKVSAFVLFVLIMILEVMFHLQILEDNIRVPMYITTVFFGINLNLGIVQSITYSYQKSWLVSLASCLTSIVSIVSVGILITLQVPGNLILFSIINGFSLLIPNMLLFIILKKGGIDVFAGYRNRIKSEKIRKSILNTGIQFFGLQLCSVVLYSTDNVIINYLFESEQVTKYSIITSVYEMGSSLFSILLIALWSSVTYYVAQNNYSWVIGKIEELIKLWVLFTIGVIVVSIMFNNIIFIWLGKNAEYYEKELIILFALYCIINAFTAIFVNVLNGMGTIKIQIFLGIIEAILNIPLSIFLAEFCGMGILGVKLGTFVCSIINFIFLPLNTIIIIRRYMRDNRNESDI